VKFVLWSMWAGGRTEGLGSLSAGVMGLANLHTYLDLGLFVVVRHRLGAKLFGSHCQAARAQEL
jgi:hypothetical protein